MPASVFIETSIPSAYVSTRQDASSVHRREATRLWWHGQLAAYVPYVSDGVIDELNKGAGLGRTRPSRLSHRFLDCRSIRR